MRERLKRSNGGLQQSSFTATSHAPDPEVINLDHNATAPIDYRVANAVDAAARTLAGNPSSQHRLGAISAEAISAAREQIAASVGSRPRDIIFTSGATEANNLALIGVWFGSRASGSSRKKIVVGATEHPAVLEPARWLRTLGAKVIEAPALPNGQIDVDFLGGLIDGNTLLVSAMLANNETGVINPVARIADLCRGHGALLHTDATQALGRIPVDFDELGVDLLSLSGHKIHGPRGTGALLCARGVPLSGMFFGGGQERDLRPGTYNTPGIVGLGIAATLLDERLTQAVKMSDLRDDLQQLLTDAVGGITVNGATAPRLPNTLNVRFQGADAEAVLAGLPTVACSTGSACSSGVPHGSHVLRAMGLSEVEARECIRFSLCTDTTAEEIATAVDLVSAAVEHVRMMMKANSP